MSKPAIADRLDQLEAQRLILTIELRCELLREVSKLLPAALRQAKGSGSGKKRTPPSPALLRLIARLAMRDARLDKRR